MTHQAVTTIDILVSVVDNYGDMGFMTELLMAFEKDSPCLYHFRIFTDDAVSVSEFMEKNSTLLPVYEILPFEASYEHEYAPIILLLFHFPLPDRLSNGKHLMFRVDYLSFDPEWISHDGDEHILSTPQTSILEVIPSFLPGGAGTLSPHIDGTVTRMRFLENVGLPASVHSKKWISLFSYAGTFSRFDFDTLSENEVVFACGDAGGISHPNFHALPFLGIDAYHTLLSLSDINIVRGEVSAVAAMHIGKPFLWDMYKERGGFPEEMSEQFLDFFAFSEEYKTLHRTLNTSRSRLDFTELGDILRHEQAFTGIKDLSSTKSLTVTLEKYIDRFYFSL